MTNPMREATLQTSDHCAKARKYEEGVLSGKIPACTYVKQAIRRQRDDLKRWSKADSPFYFDRAIPVACENLDRFLQGEDILHRVL